MRFVTDEKSKQEYKKNQDQYLKQRKKPKRKM